VESKQLKIRAFAVKVRRDNSHKFEGQDKFTGAITYSVVGKFGRDRVRLTLGTEREQIAIHRIAIIKTACVDGPDSSLWVELLDCLPRQTYDFFRTRIQNVKVVLGSTPKQKVEGLVYFIRAVESRRVKIGFSKDVNDRLRDLQIGSPEVLEIEAVVAAADLPERMLHKRFLACRKHGEWFVSTPELEAFIADVKSATLQKPLDRVRASG
jgi:hypothetical protein